MNRGRLPLTALRSFEAAGRLGSFTLAADELAVSQAAVSYRYWTDRTPLADGNPPPCAGDPYYDPNDPGSLGVVGFDSSAPSLIADFARGAI